MGTTEPALLKPLRHDPESGSIPIEQLDAVARFVDEDEDLSGEWVLFELLADDDTQAIKTLAQITRFRGKADANTVGEDHSRLSLGAKTRRTIPDPSESSATGVGEATPLTGELGGSTVSSMNSDCGGARAVDLEGLL